MRFCGFLLAFVLASFVHADDPHVLQIRAQADALRAFAVCTDCYTASEFAHAAEQFSLRTEPGLTGEDRVYVANPEARIVRHFRVSRSFDPAFDPLQALNAVPGSARPAVAAELGEGPQALLAGGFYLAEAVEAEGEPHTIERILDGVATFHQAFQRLLGQPIDVGAVVTSEPVSSGFDLVGDGAVSRLRRGLEIGLEDLFEQRLDSLLDPLDDEVVGAFFNIARASGLFATRFAITLLYPDGTETMATLKATPRLGNTAKISWRFETGPMVVKGPGLGDGALMGPAFFRGYRYEGPRAIAESIMALADRVGPSMGLEGECQKSCPTEGDCLIVCE
ncbi:MAG: hypothetical protein ACXIUL_03445 [Wenzhouxiangella sp.]